MPALLNLNDDTDDDTRLRCLHCKQPKAVDDFSIDNSRATGRNACCRACTALRVHNSRRKAQGLPPVLVLPTKEVQQKPAGSPFEGVSDFGRACRLAASLLRRIGTRTQRECEQAGIVHDAQFWFTWAEQSLAVARQYERFQEGWKAEAAKLRMLAWLSAQGWCDYHAALEQGTADAFNEHLYLGR